MKNESEIRKQLKNAWKELERIKRDFPAGTCHYRILMRYIEALEWVLEEE